MIKPTIALTASISIAGAGGAQMTGGNTISGMQTASSSTTKTTTRPAMHKKRMVKHKTTHHTPNTPNAGTMGNSM